MYFKLGDIDYDVESCSVSFDIDSDDQNLIMFIEIDAVNEDDNIDYEMTSIKLYHNNGFRVGTKTPSKLKGQVFSWDKEYNDLGEEAGIMYVLEHEILSCGTIEILDVTKKTIKIKWSGLANTYWHGETNIPFETEIEAKLPKISTVKVLNGMESSSIRLDRDTVLELLNFDDLLVESKRCKELWLKKDNQAWNKFNATLNIKITHKGVDYYAKATYINSAIKCELTVDEKCPKKLEIINTSVDTLFGKYSFYFDWK